MDKFTAGMHGKGRTMAFILRLACKAFHQTTSLPPEHWSCGPATQRLPATNDNQIRGISQHQIKPGSQLFRTWISNKPFWNYWWRNEISAVTVTKRDLSIKPLRTVHQNEFCLDKSVFLCQDMDWWEFPLFVCWTHFWE